MIYDTIIILHTWISFIHINFHIIFLFFLLSHSSLDGLFDILSQARSHNLLQLDILQQYQNILYRSQQIYFKFLIAEILPFGLINFDTEQQKSQLLDTTNIFRGFDNLLNILNSLLV